MQEAQRRQLVVGSVIAVTVGVVLYHVLFKKPNSQNSNANGKAESKQEQIQKEVPTAEPATAGKPPVEPGMDVETKEQKEDGVVANTVEAVPVEVAEKPSIVSTEESVQESGSEEDETISVADGESTDATEEELVKDVESNAHAGVRHISEQSEPTAEIGMPDAVEPVQDEIEPVTEESDTAVNVDNIEAREPTVPKEPWSDLPAVNETNVWESPDWAQQEAKSSVHSELNVNCEPFYPKGKPANRPEPTPEDIAEARRQMILKQRQRGASYKARCKYWPKCTNKKCKYVHPMYPCRNDPNCKFGDRCIYYHAKDMDARIK